MVEVFSLVVDGAELRHKGAASFLCKVLSFLAFREQ